MARIILPNALLEYSLSYLNGQTLKHFLSSLRIRKLNDSLLWRNVTLTLMGNTDHQCFVKTEVNWEKQYWIWVNFDFSWRRVECRGEVPCSRYLHRMTITEKGEAWLFGGRGQYAMLNDIWKLDLNSSVLQWKKISSGSSSEVRQGNANTCRTGGEIVLNSRQDYPEPLVVFPGNSTAHDWPSPRHASSWSHVPFTQYIYLFGGLNCQSEFLNDLWRWDIEILQWKKIETDINSTDPTPRWGHTSVVFEGSIFIFGGSNPGHCFDELWKLSFTPTGMAKWDLLDPNSSPGPRGGHSCTVSGDFMYIFAGNTESVYYNDLWRINLKICKKWEQMQECSIYRPLSRVGHQMVAIGNRIIILGGRSSQSNKFQTQICSFDTILNKFILLDESQYPGLECTGHSAVLWDRRIVLFGGYLKPSSSVPPDGILLFDMSDSQAVYNI